MKVTINYFLLILICVFTSCSKSDDNDSPIDGDGPSSSSYWPYAVGNKWHLVNPDDSEDRYDYHIYKTISYEGKTYFQVEPIGLTEDIVFTDGFREDNGLFIALHGATSQRGVNTSAGIIKSINTNLNVGEIWTDEVTLTISGAASGYIKHTNEGKILEKVASVVINGKTYSNVLKTQLKKTVYNSTTGNTFTIIYENWLAKGVGLIYEKNTYNDNDVDQYGLVSYSLK